MTAKQQALETISRLPDTASIEEIMEELYFRSKIERGLEDVRQGKVVSHQEAKQRLAQWLQQ